MAAGAGNVRRYRKGFIFGKLLDAAGDLRELGAQGTRVFDDGCEVTVPFHFQAAAAHKRLGAGVRNLGEVHAYRPVNARRLVGQHHDTLIGEQHPAHAEAAVVPDVRHGDEQRLLVGRHRIAPLGLYFRGKRIENNHACIFRT